MSPVEWTIVGLSAIALLFLVAFWVVVVQRDDANRKLDKIRARFEATGATAEKASEEILRLRDENAGLRSKIERKTSKWLEVRQKLDDELKAETERRQAAWAERDELVEKVGAALRMLKDGPAKGGPVIGGGRFA